MISKRAPRARLASTSATRFWGYLRTALLEQGQGIIETVELPQTAGLLEFWNINPQAGNDAGGATRRRNQSGVAKMFIPMHGHLDAGAQALLRRAKQTEAPKKTKN